MLIKFYIAVSFFVEVILEDWKPLGQASALNRFSVPLREDKKECLIQTVKQSFFRCLGG